MNYDGVKPKFLASLNEDPHNYLSKSNTLDYTWLTISEMGRGAPHRRNYFAFQLFNYIIHFTPAASNISNNKSSETEQFG
jgi:hypothetical protein